MKYFSLILLAVSILLNLSFAQKKDDVNSICSKEEIEENLLEGVKSANLGLKVSASYYLGERESNDAVIPLLNVLHTDKSCEARIMAALSLFKIGDSRGIYAIKRAAEYDEDERVRRICSIFYNMHLKGTDSQSSSAEL